MGGQNKIDFEIHQEVQDLNYGNRPDCSY